MFLAISSTANLNMKCQIKSMTVRKHLMPTNNHTMGVPLSQRSPLELEAAAALLMLRYQYEINLNLDQTACSSTVLPTRPPTPPPPQTLLQQLAIVAAEKCTPKEQVRTVSVTPVQPLKKRTVPPHLLNRSLTPAKKINSRRPTSISSSVTKSKVKVVVPNRQRTCTKTLLKSCRNMIREFLDNQELA